LEDIYVCAADMDLIFLAYLKQAAPHLELLFLDLFASLPFAKVLDCIKVL